MLDKRQALSKAYKALKSKRVTAIKLELESSVRDFNVAKLNRDFNQLTSDNSHYDSTRENEAYHFCPNCQYWDYATETICDANEDDGYGWLNNGDYCYDCRDEDDYQYDREDLDPVYPYGRHADMHSVDAYGMLLALWVKHIHEVTGREYTMKYNDFYDSVDNRKENIKSDLVQFAKMYYDGSCGAELTVTVPLSAKNIKLLPKFIESYKHIMATYGDYPGAENGEVPVSGAGFHMGLLFSKNMSYPIVYSSFVSRKRLEVMRQAVYKLIPAMYVLANRVGDGETRPFTYRVPELNWRLDTYLGPENDVLQENHTSRMRMGSSIKYSAIKYSNGCMEFRIFDPVFDNPGQVTDNIVVISKLMHFFTEDESVLDVFKKIDSSKFKFSFGDEASVNLNEWLDEPNALAVMNFGLSILKPEYLTLKQIRKRAGIRVTKRQIVIKNTSLEVKVDKAYALYEARYKQMVEMNKMLSKMGVSSTFIPPSTLQSKEVFKEQFVNNKRRNYKFNGDEV